MCIDSYCSNLHIYANTSQITVLLQIGHSGKLQFKSTMNNACTSTVSCISVMLSYLWSIVQYACLSFSQYTAKEVCAVLEMNVTVTMEPNNTSTVNSTMQGDDNSKLFII